MRDAGIKPDDILVVDKSLPATNDKIVIAAVDGELTVKRLHNENRNVPLQPQNQDYKPIKLNEQSNLHILSVVTNVSKSYHG